MFDTTNVNYALGKLSEVWQKAAPNIENVSEMYVNFVVMKTVVAAGILFVITAISIIMIWKSYKGFVKALNDEFSPCVIVFVIGCVFCFTTVLAGLAGEYYHNAILALYCPEMYTINEILSNVK